MENLVKLLSGDPIYKEMKIGETVVMLKTLTQEEMNDVVRRSQSINYITQSEVQKIPILRYAISSINGKELSNFDDVRKLKKSENIKEDGIAIEVFLSKLSSATINGLFNLYLEVLDEENKEKEKMKSFFQPKVEESTGK